MEENIGLFRYASGLNTEATSLGLYENELTIDLLAWYVGRLFD